MLLVIDAIIIHIILSLRHIVKSKALSSAVKSKIYKTDVKPGMMYGSVTRP